MSESNGHLPDATILDGQDRPGYVAPVAGAHAGLRFRYRPCVWAEQQRFHRGLASASVEEYEKRLRKLLADKLTGWSLPEPATPDNALRLHPAVLARVAAILLGQDANDPDPEAAEAAPFR